MARPSIPRGRVSGNVSMRLTGMKRQVTSLGGLPAVRMAWDTLGMNCILLEHGFEKRSGAPATELAFAETVEHLAQARSNVELEKALQDPVLAACIGGRQVDETTLSRFRNDNRFDWGGALEGVGERLQAFDLTRADEEGILIVDDTIAEKAGEKIEGVRRLYDSSAERYVTGHSIVNLVYSGRRVFYPLACEIVLPVSDGMDYLTKNDLALCMLKGAVRRGFRQTVVHDSAYLCDDLMQFLDSANVPWVSKCKSNRILVYHGRRLHAHELGSILARSRFRRHKRYRDIEYASAIAELPGHGLCRFVVVRNFREDEPEGADVGIKYLLASDESVHGSTVVRLYKMRWKVEEYHRSAKQDLGLKDHQGRKLRGVISHLMSVALAHILIVFMKACLPRLKGASTGQLVRDFICTSCRVNSHGARLTVLYDRILPYSEAIRHYQMARAG